MKSDGIWTFSILGVIGQVLVALMLVVGLLALLGVRGPLDWVRRVLWGYELWAAFVVAAIATGGSLFYSQIATFQPCELCWFQRICMYPLSILTLLMAWQNDNRAARYLLPLPIVGASVSIYHMLIQYGAISEPQACTVSAVGGCATNWIAHQSPGYPDASLGYLSIPTLALTAFLLLIGFLVLASTGEAEGAATLPADAER
ncbi:MAG: disulfide bond formation protein B [Gaiellaceae bacterium]